MLNRLVGSLGLACVVTVGGAPAIAQDLPKQNFKVVGTWSNLTNWQANEQPFWTKTVPESSKGQIGATIQSISELGLKGTEIVRLVRLGLFDFAHGLPIYVAEDATVEGIDIAGVAKTFDMARKTVDAYAPVLNAAVEKKYGARVLNYYTWPSQMFYATRRSRVWQISRARRCACKAPHRVISSRRSAPRA
jgi:TRAP-type C4-dicarboxylate transport system substrate-binding protein